MFASFLGTQVMQKMKVKLSDEAIEGVFKRSLPRVFQLSQLCVFVLILYKKGGENS